MLRRRVLLASTLAAPLIRAARAEGSLNIGYQKSSILVLLKQSRALEQRLGAAGIGVTWHDFPSGPPLLEALNAGAIDFGYTGDAPPIFAQAAGVDLVYVAYQPVPGASEAVLVRKSGRVKTLADLRGARIAVTKGSSAHNVLVQVLRKAGIGYDQITPVYLAPPDAAAAFRQGAVDAWSIWDPFYAIAEADPETVVLTSALSVAPSNSFLLAGRGYAHANQATLAAVIAEVTKLTSWVATNQDVLAKTLSEVTGIPEPIQRVAAARGNYNTGLMTDAVAAQQQAIADTFFDLRLIPRPIRVADAVWHPSA